MTSKLITVVVLLVASQVAHCDPDLIGDVFGVVGGLTTTVINRILETQQSLQSLLQIVPDLVNCFQALLNSILNGAITVGNVNNVVSLINNIIEVVKNPLYYPNVKAIYANLRQQLYGAIGVGINIDCVGTQLEELGVTQSAGPTTTPQSAGPTTTTTAA